MQLRQDLDRSNRSKRMIDVRMPVVGDVNELTRDMSWAAFLKSHAGELRWQFRIEQPENVGRFLIDELASLPQDSVILLAQNGNGAIEGLATLLPLEWDSSIYGFSMGKIGHLLAGDYNSQGAEIKEALLADLLRSGESQGYEHLAARVRVEDYSGLHSLEATGFRIMDVHVTLKCSLASEPDYSPSWPSISHYSPDDLPSLRKLSSRAYTHSRLAHDPTLPAAATERLHEQWIENDCQGRADLVLVAHHDDEAVGYIACMLKNVQPKYGIPPYGHIDLIAVSPSVRGRGIRLSLVQAAMNWIRQRADHVSVSTQVSNYPALGLYKRAGFFLDEAHITLHKSL